MARAQGVSLAFMTTLFICVIQRIGGASFDIHNKCSYTVWAAGSPGGGKALASGESWTVQLNLSSVTGRFWGRTGCSFDSTGQGNCKTGDCGGLLSCQGSGKPPATMVEYDYQVEEYDYQFEEHDVYQVEPLLPSKPSDSGVSVDYRDRFNSYNISLVNGFNLPVSIIPSNHSCDAVTCSSNISAICPPELRVPDGCNSACTRFNTPQYCCTGKYSGKCSATKYSRIFKRQCPQAHTYPADNTAITSTCLGIVNITIVFCGDIVNPLPGSPTMSPHGSPVGRPLILSNDSTHPSGKTSRKMVIFLGSMLGSTALFVMLCFVFGRRVRQWKSSVRTDNNIDARENFGEVYFDYKALRDSTGNFDRNNMLGKGGFGEVYKGRLLDGRDVAVKKLNGKQTTQAAEEFLTEVKLISSVRHRNLVRLLGCCRRGHKRLLVFEFMSNNSLDKHLFGEIRNPLRWESRLNIIVGTARGLAYLHGDSDVRIIHRDIKCANILLDDRFHPKIADFGLARFFPESQTHVSTRVGGTIGYTAPEYAVHGQLTEKADVYSYGIVVLEIVSGRKCLDARLPAPLQLLLEWAWNQFEQNQVLDIVDPLLEGQYPLEQALRVITIALLCIQGSWTQRPAMSQVVSMLTDNSDRIAQPTRPAFIDAATDTPANFLPIPDSATQPAAPTRTSHGSISVSLLPR